MEKEACYFVNEKEWTLLVFSGRFYRDTSETKWSIIGRNLSTALFFGWPYNRFFPGGELSAFHHASLREKSKWGGRCQKLPFRNSG